MNRMPQPIPYQGSKRNIAYQILQYVPVGVERIIEPFTGSAAVSVAAAYRGLAQKFLLNGINKPLADLLQLIINQPLEIAHQYQDLWKAQLGNEREFYNEVRAKFNQTQQPELLLYLLARCVKASVRYNANGEFNQAPDNRRKGRHPASMRQEITHFSRLLKDRTIVSSLDFRETIDLVESESEFVYLDPPYQGTSGTRDSRYSRGVDPCALIEYLEKLNAKKVMFALSYDGVKGDKVYGLELPRELQMHRLMLHAGRSTQSTLLGRRDITYESLYLSHELVERLNSQLDLSDENFLSFVGSGRPPVQLKLEMNGL